MVPFTSISVIIFLSCFPTVASVFVTFSTSIFICLGSLDDVMISFTSPKTRFPSFVLTIKYWNFYNLVQVLIKLEYVPHCFSHQGSYLRASFHYFFHKLLLGVEYSCSNHLRIS